MIKTLPVIFIFLSQLCVAQETTRIVNNSQNGDHEEYYVLSSDKKIRQGSYERKTAFYHVEGFYADGKKEGMWTEYSKRSRLLSRGKYSKGERVGLWKFYNEDGELEQEFDFDNKKMVSDNLLSALKEKVFLVYKGGDSLSTLLDMPPLYIGGKTKMQLALSKNSNLPLIAMLTKTIGKIEISFQVDTSGVASHFRLVSGVGDGCDEEAMKMVKHLPSEWLPATLNGQKVIVQHRIIISVGG
jgi:periplasmic protein TonB